MKKDLLKLLDLTREDITKILDVADQMKYNQKHGLQIGRASCRERV